MPVDPEMSQRGHRPIAKLDSNAENHSRDGKNCLQCLLKKQRLVRGKVRHGLDRSMAWVAWVNKEKLEIYRIN